LQETKYWHSKKYGVILVEHEFEIEILWKLFCEQDSYWEHYKNIIKVAPIEIESERDIERMCEYCGKTDIYKFDEIKSKIDFFMYQYSLSSYEEKLRL